MPSAASHVLMIEPVQFRFNPETAWSNAFQAQAPPSPEESATLAAEALNQHRRFRDLLIGHGVTVTTCRSLESTPDAPFCNNWFSTHAARGSQPATLCLYPLLSPTRRLERRPDLVELLRPAYDRVLDISRHEAEGRYLESTGSLCLDHEQGVAYTALSPRTDRELTREWCETMGFELVAFTAVDGTGMPYYHTNVMMFLGQGVAGVVLESIPGRGERRAVVGALRRGGRELIELTRAQAAAFCGNCLALANEAGDSLLAMSTTAYGAFSEPQRGALAASATLIHTELSTFERLAGGSARCLLAELY